MEQEKKVRERRLVQSAFFYDVVMRDGLADHFPP
jgi:hypothetical protein